MYKTTILIIVFITVHVKPQIAPEWIADYQYHDFDHAIASSIAIDSLNYIYISGTSNGGILTEDDYVIIKYNSAGVQQWVARYNGIGNADDHLYAMKLNNGNIFITGSSLGIGTSNDCLTIKYNSDGKEIWSARYNGPASGSDYARSIAIDDYGNVFIAGSSEGNNSYYDFLLIKYNPDGEEEWVARYNGPGNDGDFIGFNSLEVDRGGNIYISGYSIGDSSGSDFTTIKYDTNGELQWLARFDSLNQFEYVSSMTVDDSGYVYVTGESQRSENTDFLTIKYNSNGELNWASYFNGPANLHDWEPIILQPDNSNFYICGRTNGLGSSPTDVDILTVKYNLEGEVIWFETFDGPGNDMDYPSSIIRDYKGNIYIVGASEQGFTLDYDFVTIKYSSEGSKSWTVLFDSDNELATDVVIDSFESIYVTGNGSDGITTIKYSSTTSIQTQTYSDKEFELHQNYPNPFNPSTKISWQSPVGSHQTIKVFDILGNEVATLVDEYNPAGSYEVEFDATDLSSGIYFYKLQAMDFVQTKKMTLLR